MPDLKDYECGIKKLRFCLFPYFPAKELPPGHDAHWLQWKTLNRIRTGAGCCKAAMDATKVRRQKQ